MHGGDERHLCGYDGCLEIGQWTDSQVDDIELTKKGIVYVGSIKVR